MTSKTTFRSNGKLLLSGEYVVLYGAAALAIPTSRGQELTVETDPGTFAGDFEWITTVENQEIYKARFDGAGRSKEQGNDEFTANLEELFCCILEEKGQDFLMNQGLIRLSSNVEFPLDWGLGSSSTLVNNLAQWTGMHAFYLNKKVFGGSGYDIACASSQLAIEYRLELEQPIWEEYNFMPPFSNQLYFIHLNRKQNSREGIAVIQAREGGINGELIEEITVLAQRMRKAMSIGEFEECLTEHEGIIGRLTGLKPIKQDKFADFNGAVKSLGAWGGDFVLATGSYSEMDYFRELGFTTIIAFKDMILNYKA
ncbi:MAG: GYDIA family GHMP kinase [Vicingaceae bacterium]